MVRRLPATSVRSVSWSAMFLCLVAAPAASVPVSSAVTPAWAFPLTLSVPELSAICGRDGTWLDSWLAADLHYDAAVDGLRGSVRYGADFWLRDAEALSNHARITKAVGPLSRCGTIDIEVRSAVDGAPRRLREDDLVWHGSLAAGNGIIRLDTAEYVAVIPGLKIGDRLRVVWHWEWFRRHGMPVVDLRPSGNCPARAAVRVQVPADQNLQFQVVGADSLCSAVSHRLSEAGGVRVGFWELRDAREAGTSLRNRDDGALTLVTHLVDGNAARPAAAFVGAGTWAGAAAGYRERVQGALVTTPELKALAERIVTGKATASERIEALYGHVQSTTRYLGLYVGQGGIIPTPPDDTRRLGYGDCKGLSTYLIALCRAVGIEAWPVLVLAAEDQPLADAVPNLAQFNHFIVWADDGRGGCWLDPTLENIPAGVLVPVDALWPVLTTRPGSEGLSTIPRPVWEPGRRLIRVDGSVDSAGHLQAEVSCVAEGAGGRVLAARLDRLDERRRKTALSELLLSPALRLAEIRTSGHEDDTDGDANPLPTWRLEVHTTSPLPAGGGTVFMPTEIAALTELHAGPSGPTEVTDPRLNPDRLESWRLALPDGWRLASPDSFSCSGPGIHWSRTVLQADGNLILRRCVDWDEAALSPAQSEAFRRIMAEVVARERTPLLLKGGTP